MGLLLSGKSLSTGHCPRSSPHLDTATFFPPYKTFLSKIPLQKASNK